MPDLVQVASDFEDEELEVLIVALEEQPTYTKTAEEVLSFMKRRNITLHALYFEGDVPPLMDAYDLPGGLPFTAVYDAQRKKVGELRGPAGHEQFAALVERAL